MATGSKDLSVKLWDFGSGKLVSTQRTEHLEEINDLLLEHDHEYVINTVKFHPDGQCIASGSRNNMIRLWDIRSQNLVEFDSVHAASIEEIDFHPSGNYLLSCSSDSTVKIQDMRKGGKILYTLYGHNISCNSVNFS